MSARKYRPKTPDELEEHPEVSIHLPIYNELYVVQRLIRAICNFDWPKNKLEILVLDDSTDQTSAIIEREAEAHQAQGFNVRVLRRESREGFKAGALQNALHQTTARYVAIFDADFIPTPDFLIQTIPLLEEDPGLGLVQARWGHVNRDYNLLTETIALGIDGHHIIEQTGRCAGDLLFNFNGSAGVLRTEAIHDAGGWTQETLSEDLDLSYRMQLKGWKAHYLRDVRVPAEIPPNITDFKNQQYRWAKGSIQASRKLMSSVWSSPLNLSQKLEATIHLTNYVVHLFLVMMLLLTPPIIALQTGFIQALSPFSLIFIISTLNPFLMYYSALRFQEFSLTKIARNFLSLMVIGFGLTAQCSVAVIQGLRSYGGVFNRTPKYDIKDRQDDWRDRIYNPLRKTALLEWFLLLYSIAALAFAYHQKLYTLSIFLSFYALGYASIISLTRRDIGTRSGSISGQGLS